MKRKVTCFTSMALAVLMAVSPVAGSSVSAFAAEPSDDTTAIQVTPSKEDLSDEIVVEADSDAIEVEKEMQVSVKIGDTGESDIVVDTEYHTGDAVPVHVTAENPTDKAADFRLYFWDYGETLPEDKGEWADILVDACEDVRVAELQDADEYAVDLKQNKDNVQEKVSVVFEKDEKDQLTAVYLSIEIPAEAALDTVFHISSDVAETVTIIPVFGAESENAFYGDASTVQWKENPIIVEKDEAEDAVEIEPETEDSDAIVVETEEPADSFLSIYVGDSPAETETEEPVVEEEAETEESDTEAEPETDTESEVSVEAETEEDAAVMVTPDTADLNASDFASMRLVVLADDASVITNDSDVIGQYDNVYLLQFTSIQQAMNAYTYYKDKVTAVEPDATVETAAETESVRTADIAMTEDENPVAMLNEVETSEEVQDAHGVIALIDTGVSESENVIDRVSVIDDVLEGNGHGDEMVKAIVSQDAEAEILSIRAMDDNGFGTISSLVAAMEYAIEQKVAVINLSLYAKATLSTSVLEQEILKATDAGILVVGSAGNDGQDAAGYMPGAVEEAYIIGAAKEDGSRLETSNFGETVDYNVVAGSTSEAAALFTGYVSANGLDAVEGVVNQGLIYMTDYVTEEFPDDTNDGVELVLRPVGEGSFIYDNGKDAMETIDFETVYPIEEAKTVHLEFDQTAYVFIQDDESHFVGTYEKYEAGNVMDLELTTETGYVVWVVFDEETATEWMGLYDEGDEDLFQTASSVTYYRQVSDGLTACGKFQVDGKWAFCTDHYATTPSAGTAITSIAETSNANLKKVLYYGYGGPGTILGTSDSDWMQTTIAAHIAVQGTNAGYETHRTFWNRIQSLPAAPSGFKVYMAYTPGSLQDLCYWEYNPIEYTNISVKKSWSDYNNESGARPSSIQVGLYWSTKTPVDTSGKPYKTATLNASNNWSYTWKNEEHSNAGTTYYYAVKELSVPTYYTVSYTQPECKEGNASATVINKIQEAYLKLHKDSALPNVSDNNDCYSLEGAEYTVYTTRSGNNLSGAVGVLKTDENGDSNALRLLPKTYYIKETKAPKGFEPNPQIYTVKLTTGNTTSKPYVLNVEDVPGNDPTGIEITKIWNGPETDTIPTLEGTQFTIKYYDGYYTKDNLPSTPKRTWVLEVKKDKNTGKFITGLADSYLVEGSDEFYRDGSGLVCLPYGTISIQETKPAAGYTLEGYLTDENGKTISTDSEVYVAQINKDTGAVALQGGNKFTGYNTPVFGSIKLKKYDSDGKTPLAGVTFQCVGKTVEDVYTATTDSNGEIVFDNLYPDVYTITETSTVDGHTLLKEPIVVEVPMRVTEEYINEFNVDRDSVTYDPADDIYYIHEFTYEITNDVTFKMPMSGGLTTPMTFVPLIAGMGILGGLGVVGFRKKRKK